ncbi:dephospho-CoA kinase [Herbiconiux liukaitaii]|uniref:dephospho-CoA kinase n=1 Tax=Herbiconiux liukaitaii TaxID=3342799 RepID=UPI0035B6D3CD
MYVIGLTGGIAAGKSTVSKRLAELGAVTIDADQLAREAVAPGSAGLDAIRSRFGDDVIAADGSLDRPALGAIVFADETARLDLNGITHPAVIELFAERLRSIAAASPEAIVVYDVPLMVETGGRRGGVFEFVIVVEAPEEQRLARLIELRGMDPAEAARRIASQASDSERRAIADVVIDSGGTLDETIDQVDAAWEQVRGWADAKHAAAESGPTEAGGGAAGSGAAGGAETGTADATRETGAP